MKFCCPNDLRRGNKYSMLGRAIRNCAFSGLMVVLIGVMASMGTWSEFAPHELRSEAETAQGVSHAIIISSNPSSANDEKGLLAAVAGSGNACCSCDTAEICSTEKPDSGYIQLARADGPTLLMPLSFQPPHDPPRI
jgi:hypothetical protein